MRGQGRNISSHSDTLYSKPRQENGRQWGLEIDTEKAPVFYWNNPNVSPRRMWTRRWII